MTLDQDYFAHQLVRELEWSLFSPAITEFSLENPGAKDEARWHIGDDEESRYLLDKLRANPAPLEVCIDQLNDRRLGARFEALWRYFFDHHSFYRVLAANLQINANGRTLGALDFLLEDSRSHQIIHLELAVKFYLYYPLQSDPNPENLSAWIGPNPDDNLQLKLDHLRQHQLPLSENPVVTAALRTLGLPLPQQRTAIVKGYLFSPWQQASDLQIPMTSTNIRSNCLKGRWLYDHQFDALAETIGDGRVALLEKSQWLDSTPPANLSVDTAREKIANYSSMGKQGRVLPPMMLAVEGTRPEQISERYFVMPSSWPGSIRTRG